MNGAAFYKLVMETREGDQLQAQLPKDLKELWSEAQVKAGAERSP